ncbi:STAS domain-containing protein, partial [Halomonas sp. BBD48]|nr:STAS domain-containing protein [Halomonas sp. BBD48]
TSLLQGAARLEVNANVLVASGEAGFDMAAALAEKGCGWLMQQPQGSEVVFDLSGVDQASSAALSVMLEWLRCAHRRQLSVVEVRLSAPLSRLTAMAGLEQLLPEVHAETSL